LFVFSAQLLNHPPSFTLFAFHPPQHPRVQNLSPPSLASPSIGTPLYFISGDLLKPNLFPVWPFLCPEELHTPYPFFSAFCFVRPIFRNPPPFWVLTPKSLNFFCREIPSTSCVTQPPFASLFLLQGSFATLSLMSSNGSAGVFLPPVCPSHIFSLQAQRFAPHEIFFLVLPLFERYS